MKVGDWTSNCISPGIISVEAAKAQRDAWLKDIMEFRKRRHDDYEAWSSIPIVYDPEWDNPKWNVDNPMPAEMAHKKLLYYKQQAFNAVKASDQDNLARNTEKLKDLGPIIRNPNYDPTHAKSLPGITLTPIVKDPEPKPTQLQKFKAWLRSKTF